MKQLCDTSPCNSGTCEDLFNDYHCECPANAYGKSCETISKVCDVADPCLNGNCMPSQGVATCACSDGYEGDRCETQVHYCGDNTTACQNGGVCVPSLDDYTCECLPGFSGLKDCQYNNDDCSKANCNPNYHICMDMVDSAYCKCTDVSKVGPRCDKDVNSNFDLYFPDCTQTNTAHVPYPIHLDSTGFSLAFYVQFNVKGGTGEFLSIWTLPQENSLMNKEILLYLNETGLTYYDEDNRIHISQDDTNKFLQLPDLNWHYVVVRIDKAAGQLSVITDGIQSSIISISPGAFDEYIWVFFGSHYDVEIDGPVKDKQFCGKLSRLTLYSRALDFDSEVSQEGFQDVDALFPDVLWRWGSELHTSTGVEEIYPSGVKQSCPTGYKDGADCDVEDPAKTKVMMSREQCPDNIIQYSQFRFIEVNWDVPDIPDAVVKMTDISGDLFVWGRHLVAIEATNAGGNKALCLFKVYVQNDQCTHPQEPRNIDGMVCIPEIKAKYKDYQQCSIFCLENYDSSIHSPLIHTCGPTGNWDPEKRFVPYRISPCGRTSDLKNDVTVRIEYNAVINACDQTEQALITQLRNTLILLKDEWEGLCKTPSCSDVQITTDCTDLGTGKGTQLIGILTFPEVGQVTKDGQPWEVSDMFEHLLKTKSETFDYSDVISGAIPDDHEISTQHRCIAPRVMNYEQTKCVECGPGTYYDDVSKECQFCPIGTYQAYSNQTSCLECTGETTTETVGAFDEDECKAKCDAGKYFDKITEVCTDCPRGFYQPDEGMFYCEPCPAEKTTKTLGTKLKSECSNDCPPGQEIGAADTCVGCDIGYYRTSDDMTCQKCDTGLVTMEKNATSKDSCDVADNPKGTYRDPDDPTKFIQCPLGEYQEEKWKSSCEECGNGYSTRNKGSTSQSDCLLECPAGKEPIGPGACSECEQGSYKPADEPLDYCTSCSGRMTTIGRGSTSESDCNLYSCQEGYEPNNNNDACQKCAKGEYQPLPNKEECIPCQQNESTREEGSTKQSDCESLCPSGYEKLDNGTCSPCERGYYKDNTVDKFMACKACDSDFVTEEGVIGTSEGDCTFPNCVEGYFVNGTGCSPCPMSTYQDLKWQDECKKCDENKDTEKIASTSINDCLLNCPKGKESRDNSDTCEDCLEGYYKDEEGATTCKPCDDFSQNEIKISRKNGSTSKDECDTMVCLPGFYLDNGACSECQLGFYQNERWQDECKPCDNGLTTYSRGAIQATDCQEICEAGNEFDLTLNQCKQCDQGFYRTANSQQRECEPCDADLTTPDVGSVSATECTLSKCQPGFSYINQQCTECSKNSYQDEPNKIGACTPCGNGKVTEGKGSTSANDCVYPCDLPGISCEITTQVCENLEDINDNNGISCKCREHFVKQENGDCIHKCDITDYCGAHGTCRRSPVFSCECKDKYSGALCDIRPDAASISDNDTETLVIALVTSLAGLLFLLLLVVCVCVMTRKNPKKKLNHTSELDDRVSLGTRSMKANDDYPTFAVNPVFPSKAPSQISGPSFGLPSHSVKNFGNAVYNGDEDPFVYTA